MRSFVVVTFLFIILLSATFANSSFIRTSSAELIDAAESIPQIDSIQCEAQLNLFEEKWNKFKKAASFSVSFSELNKISCLVEELRVHHSNRNDMDFDHALTVMLNHLRELSRFEQLSIDTIF